MHTGVKTLTKSVYTEEKQNNYTFQEKLEILSEWRICDLCHWQKSTQKNNLSSVNFQ